MLQPQADPVASVDTLADRTTITFQVDANNQTGYTDEYIAQLWHINQANPAAFGDADACNLAERLAREIVRRYVSEQPPALWTHQGRHVKTPAATPEASAIQALLNRARHVLLIGAWLGKPENVTFAKGSINALKSMQSDGGAYMAARDASMGGYHPAAGLQAAWACLPVDIENLSFAEVQEFLRLDGLQVPFDPVADSDLNAVGQLKDAPVAVVNVDDKHDAARADLGDGSGEHGQSLVGVVGAEVQRTGIVTSRRIASKVEFSEGHAGTATVLTLGDDDNHDMYTKYWSMPSPGWESFWNQAHWRLNLARLSADGARWTASGGAYVVNDFGDLVAVPA